tara:strand:+ start:41 stop:748 length:708 start_codon:yes stop_codon:yes gene_type:complete
MATYTPADMAGGGALGEALTPPATYTFTFSTPAFPSQSVYFGDAYFVLNSSVGGNPSLTATSAIGPLNLGSIPINQNFTTTVNNTFNFNVSGGTRGSNAIIAITTVGGVMERANVTRGGSNFINGDTITILQADLIAGGFTTANQDAIFDINLSNIETGYGVSSDLSGTYDTPTGDVLLQQFASSSNSDGSIFNIGFPIVQNVGSGNGTFNFTPTSTIPANSYTIQSTGHFTLVI